MLKGRLGLESASIPQKDRHGVVWLARGHLGVESGTLRFITAGYGDIEPGTYAIPYQMLSCVVLEPGTTVSHDAMRLLARHGTGLASVGSGGVRFYASMPPGPDASARARRHATLWADEERRIHMARRMYAWRMGEIFPAYDLNVLRGMEGARSKKMYKLLADQYGIQWRGRKYDRNKPLDADPANQAINHVSVAVVASAKLAVAVTGAIPQLGFIHEDSGYAFPLDIADLFRDEITIPTAFGAIKQMGRRKANVKLETAVRRHAGDVLRRGRVVAKMIDKIKELLDDSDGGGHKKRV